MLTRGNKKDIINTIVKQSMRNEKRRNLMIIIATVLSSFLISFACLMSTALIQNQKDQVTDTYEATYINVSKNNVKNLEKASVFQRIGIYYLIGERKFEKGYSGIFVYLDEPMLYMSRQQGQLIDGNLPSKVNEIVVSRSWMERYGDGKGLGDSVTLAVNEFQGDYIITGVLDTIESSKESYPFMISEERLKQVAEYKPNGYRAYVHLNEKIKLENKKNICNEIAKQENLLVSFNNEYFVYSEKTISVEQMTILLALVGIVFGGSCIVIQSIFQISIIEKIQSYGQLRTIGATRIQIKKIVRNEARRLATIGGVIGVMIGSLVWIIIMFERFSFKIYLVIVFGVILICYYMVMLSVYKPIKIASKVAPIDAVKFMPGRSNTLLFKKRFKKITPMSLGILNFIREPKKVISVAVSVSIAGILLMIISSAILVQSPERMAYHDFQSGDYRVYLDSDEEHKNILLNGNPLNDELKTKIQEIPGVTDVLIGRQSAHYRFDYRGVTSSGMCDMITKENQSIIKNSLVKGKMPSNSYEILVIEDYLDFGVEAKEGMRLKISLGEKEIPVTISGFFSPAKLPIAQGHGEKGFDAPMMYLPESLFKELLPGVESYNYSWDINCEKKYTEEVGARLMDIVSAQTDIGVDSVFSRIKAYESNNAAVYGILQSISWVIFLFGAINLVNITLSNQRARYHENSILHSVGLTNKQISLMTLCESICYIACSIIIVLAVGTPISILVSNQMGEINYGSVPKYQFPLLNMTVYVIMVCLLELILSIWTIKKQRSNSIVEQTRIE